MVKKPSTIDISDTSIERHRDSYMQSVVFRRSVISKGTNVILTPTSVISTRTILISTRRVRFPHAELDFFSEVFCRKF
jgi:hypothetical protein